MIPLLAFWCHEILNLNVIMHIYTTHNENIFILPVFGGVGKSCSVRMLDPSDLPDDKPKNSYICIYVYVLDV